MRTTISSRLFHMDWIVVAFLLLLWAGVVFAMVAAPASAQSTSQPIAQPQCPVMANQAIDPKIYSEYRGQRVYFCCLSCKADFDANPEKYLANLPQFAASRSDNVVKPPKRPRAWMRKWIEPAGATTLTLLVITVCLALLRRIRWPRPGFILRLHKIAGVCALCGGLLHATMILLR